MHNIVRLDIHYTWVFLEANKDLLCTGDALPCGGPGVLSSNGLGMMTQPSLHEEQGQRKTDEYQN